MRRRLRNEIGKREERRSMKDAVKGKKMKGRRKGRKR